MWLSKVNLTFREVTGVEAMELVETIQEVHAD